MDGGRPSGEAFAPSWPNTSGRSEWSLRDDRLYPRERGGWYGIAGAGESDWRGDWDAKFDLDGQFRLSA